MEIVSPCDCGFAAMCAIGGFAYGGARIAMPVRLFNGDAAAWEPPLALLIMAVTALLLLVVGSRVYAGSLLRTNGKTSWATAWRAKTS